MGKFVCISLYSVNYPKISIVTPSFNQGKYLEETILSIVNQKYPNLEYIIIDGGSTDNSVEIIKRYEEHLNYWVSEKDKGQSDAINKGLRCATGELFNWINSDDFLEDGALFKIAEAYRNNPDKKIFCFGQSILTGNSKKIFSLKNNPEDKHRCFCEPVISQPSIFYSMDGVRKIGGLNEFLHYSMDREWFLRFLFYYGTHAIHAGDENIAVFRIHNETKTSKGYDYFLNDVGNILFSLARQSGMHSYCELLKRGYRVDEKYIFNFDPGKEKNSLIEQMIVHFLLKWWRLIYTKKQFLFAIEMLDSISFSSISLTAEEQGWLDELRKNASSKNWFYFKLKRKIKYIFLTSIYAY